MVFGFCPEIQKSENESVIKTGGENTACRAICLNLSSYTAKVIKFIEKQIVRGFTRLI
jgi:hypothetical protein